MTTDIMIYYNPECGSSRNRLAMICNAGIEPHVIAYLKVLPSGSLLESGIDADGGRIA
jgi:arsenate reductase